MDKSFYILLSLMVCVLMLTAALLGYPMREDLLNFPEYGEVPNADTRIGGSDIVPTVSVSDYNDRARKLWRLGLKRKALSLLGEALAIEPDNLETLRALGDLNFQNEQFEAASGYFARYNELNPGAIDGYTFYAVSLMCAEQYDDATTVIKKGLDGVGAAAPGSFYFILAAINQLQGDEDETERFLNKAYKELGPSVINFVNTKWFSFMKESKSYLKIVEAEFPADPANTGGTDRSQEPPDRTTPDQKKSKHE